ncbi:CHAT domain-containing protein [Hyalangium rubrum]|uniref:CHAT domain-containing protein n=1 Tax=Hyalangium rubrum TaxID=3103134 RepID=A0ABU5H728_9BACT|nr:CHAT domain-containing protein [Hyalangium sp. s54d21]MDY7228894.1 CHAT domain-containing protein [Hyalangium sp. s54d21]
MLQSPASEGARGAARRRPGHRVTSRPRWTWNFRGSRLLWLLALVAGLAAGTFALRQARRTPALERVLLAGEPTRRIEARVTHPLADHHRPFRAEPSVVPRVPLKELAWLERHQEWRALVATYLIRAQYVQARARLPQEPSTPDDASDLAVVALQEKDFNEALRLLDVALDAAPRHPQALWNRALVLRELDLPFLAANAFDEVARLGEPGWSEEARAEALRLRQDIQARRLAWATLQANVRSPGGLTRLVSSSFSELPGTARVVFYKAVRSSPSRDAVLALLPIAQQLDALQGDASLEGYVRHVAQRDFRKRAPLARDYGLLLQDAHANPEELLKQALAAGEEDIAMGVMLDQGTIAQHPEVFAALIKNSDDPWVRMMGEGKLAMQEFSSGRAGRAGQVEAALVALHTGCDAQRFAYRCLDIAKSLTDLYIALDRLAEAQGLASRSLALARASGEWAFERTFLQELSNIAISRYESPLARAYLQESLERDPEQCVYVHQNLANLAMLDFDIPGERRHMELALQCGQPLTKLGAYLLAELARFGVSDWEVEQFHRTLDALRRSSSSSGTRVWLRFIEGQFELERDRDKGRHLLRQAIEEARRLPDTDLDARNTRAHGYSALILDAGRDVRAEGIEELLALVAEDRRIAVPMRCAVVVEDGHSRLLIVVRGAQGEVLTHFDGARTRSLGNGEGVIPAHQLEALRGCQQVEVLASPSALGSTRILPTEMAWSYRVGHTVHPPPGPEARRLIVHNVEPPRELGLPNLSVRTLRPGTPGVIELRGAQATLPRVLAEMEQATEIEIHAHGLSRPELFDAPFVALTRGSDGQYALTAARLRQHPLKRAPVVFLAACGTASRNPLSHKQAFGLPDAFIEAGASAVLAATVEVPDTVGLFFEAVGRRIRDGAPPAVALGAERAAWLKTRPQERWVGDVLIFE